MVVRKIVLFHVKRGDLATLHSPASSILVSHLRKWWFVLGFVQYGFGIEPRFLSIRHGSKPQPTPTAGVLGSLQAIDVRNLPDHCDSACGGTGRGCGEWHAQAEGGGKWRLPPGIWFWTLKGGV